MATERSKQPAKQEIKLMIVAIFLCLFIGVCTPDTSEIFFTAILD